MPISNARSNVLGPFGGMTAAVRSGRFEFKTPGTSDGTRIAEGTTGTSYRVFNAGNNPFKVRLTAGSAVTLKEASSVDVGIEGDIYIADPAAQEVQVEGIYEYLGDPPMPIRSGRFAGDVTVDDIRIVQGRAGYYYRIFNSAKKSVFIVKWAGGGPAVEVLPKCSLDLAVTNWVEIRQSTFPDSDTVEGIYGFLDIQNPIRSGRFKIRQVPSNPALVNPAQPRKIIDLRRVDGKKAWYRIFNSGENQIIVDKGAGELTRLEEGQSFDFVAEADPTTNTGIYVKSTAAKKAIEGIYEFLGTED